MARVYFLHLTRSDFDIFNNGTFWQTDAIDLYFNSFYQNFSLVRSRYGLGAVKPMMGGSTPNDVWVGMKYVDPYPVYTDLYDEISPYDSFEDYSGSTPNDIIFTDSGFIIDNRFVDTTGPINIISYTAKTPEYSSTFTLNYFSSSQYNSIFPEEWVESSANITVIDGLFVNNAPRYALFQMNWNYDPGDVDIYVRVEVGPPVMMPKYGETGQVLSKLPSWMAMSELANPPPATPELDTNTSLGGKLVNAVAGEWLDDLSLQVNYRQLQLYIDTADTNQMAWCYRSPVLSQFPNEFVGDDTVCVLAYWDSEFYQCQPSEDIVFWDEDNQYIYSNKLYNSFQIDGVTYSQELHQIWNSFDDIGLSVNLYRLPGEDNVSFKGRILDVYRNPPGVGLESFQFALRRELDLWKLYGSTPDSNFIGATPTLLEIPDILNDPSYMQPNGMPTTKFVKLVNYLAKKYPTTWGEFVWNSAYADLTDDNYTGYSVLPLLMDATPWQDSQSGVGDLKDLLVYPPTNDTGPRQFEAQFNVQGKVEQSNRFNAPLVLNLDLKANGSKLIYDNPSVSVWLTVEFTQFSSGVTSFYSFELTSASDVNNLPGATPTPASVAALRIFDPDGGTNSNITLFNKSSMNSINSRLFLTDIASISLHSGQWNGTSYSSVPSGVADVWFSNDPITLLALGTTTPITVTNDAATPTILPPLTVLMQSTQVFNSVGVWNSETIPLSITINNNPDGTVTNTAIPLPNINWDPYISGGQTLEVQLTSFTILKPDGTSTTVPASSIAYGTFFITLLDSSNNVLDSNVLNIGNVFDGFLNNALTATALQINTADNPRFVAFNKVVYPVSQNTTFYFTAPSIATITGLVDENGPWVGGYAPASNNQNYLFGNYKFTLGDFDIPTFTFPSRNSITTTITSINANDIGDESIVVWLDTNTVKQNAQGNFGPFRLFVRVNPEPSVSWNPVIHGGTYFEGNQESYLYVEPTFVNAAGTSGYTVLPSTLQQGAPILGFMNIDSSPTIYTANNAMRQTAFFDFAATPNSLTLVNNETVYGNYSNQLYASYPNIYNIQVADITDPTNVKPVQILSNSTSGNIIYVASPSHTTIDNKYQLTYEVANSFYVDNNYQGHIPPTFNGSVITSAPDYTQQPKAIVVSNAATPWHFVYESSVLQSATPVNVPLNPFYSTVEEGFIFLANEDYEFDHAVLNFSAQTMVQEQDYINVSIYAFDIYGNPKPNMSFNATTTAASFGFFAATPQTSVTVTTDQYGHALLMINSYQLSSVVNLPIIDTLTLTTLDNSYTISEIFRINPRFPAQDMILRAIPAQESILSSGLNAQLIYGLVTDQNFMPIPDATVNWTKGRTNFDLFAPTGQPDSSGVVTTGSNGAFIVGPFPSAATPGYWLMSTQVADATPGVGDIVFWLEYPDAIGGTGEITGLPGQIIQLATPTSAIPPYSTTWQHPVYYNNAEPIAATPGGSFNWIPPTWFPLPVFDQWEFNMFSAQPGPDETQDWSNYSYNTLPPNIDYDF